MAGPDHIRENRQWTIADLRTILTTVYPMDLAYLVTAVTEGRLAQAPVILAG